MPQEFVGFSESALAYHRQAKILDEEPPVHVAHDCYVAPASTAPGNWFEEYEGGVFHGDGSFVEVSAQPRALGHAALKRTQAVRKVPEKTVDVPRAVFGGMILDHFGHFLIETPGRMWALQNLPADLPWIFLVPPSGLREYHYKFLELLGLARSRLLIATDWLYVSELFIPGTTFCYGDWVARAYIRPFQRAMISSRREFNERIYLSREHLRLRVTVGEAELVDLLRQNGWTILKPEELPTEDQISLFRSKSLIAGLQGSAFHVSLFAPPGCRMIQLCRNQSERNFSMLDALSGADVTYFDPLQEHPLPPDGNAGPFLLDLDKTAAFLRDRDLIGKAVSFSLSRQGEKQPLLTQYEGSWHYMQSILHGNAAGRDAERQQASIEHARNAVAVMPWEHSFRENLIVQVGKVEGPGAAMTLAREAQAAYPAHPGYHYLCSMFEDYLGHHEDALAAIKAALALEPENMAFKSRLALQFYRCKLLDDAENVLQEVISRNPAPASDLYLLSLVQDEKELPESALQSARQAAALAPYDSLIGFQLVKLLINLNKRTEAEELAAIYRERFPSIPEFKRIGKISGPFSVPDHGGEPYAVLLDRLHAALRPKTYFEIGTASGASLALAKCASVAVDPNFQLSVDAVGKKPACQLFQLTSDEFFAAHDLGALLGGKVELAFLDGLHLFEFLLRDFMNTEAHCAKSSVVALHDCLPTDLYVGRRGNETAPDWPPPPHPSWWAGDVWKVLVILRRYRPDLKIYAFDAPPTGLVLVANLDPDNKILRQDYDSLVSEYKNIELADYGLERLYREIDVLPTREIADAEAICKLFCRTEE